MTDRPTTLLAFALGPVQPFIAAARRTQDLFVGSHILSLLARAACQTIEEQGGKLLYPIGWKDSKATNLPNKLLARFDDPTKAEQAGRGAVVAVQKAWCDMADEVRDWLAKDGPKGKKAVALSDHFRRMWADQTGSALELYWAVLDSATTKLPGYELADYGDQVEASESLLAARKLLRSFTPHADTQVGPMSTIGGQLPALRLGERDSDREIKAFWITVAQAVNKQAVLDLEGGERLDAISTVKRFIASTDHYASKFSQRYPSTSDVAAADLRGAILRLLIGLQRPPSGKEDELAQLSNQLISYHKLINDNAYLPRLRERVERDIPGLVDLANGKAGGTALSMNDDRRVALLRYDGDLLFAQSISGRMLVNDYDFPSEAKNGHKEPTEETARFATKLADSARAVVRAARRLDVTATTPYYAVVAFDGDRMGALLRRMTNSDRHEVLSQALADFASDGAKTAVESDTTLGRLVYAGGDDVLALLPITTALAAVTDLQDRYRKALVEKLTEKGMSNFVSMDGTHPLATASAGIVIAHHLTPLDFVLAQARAAEHIAKEEYGRNAVTVRILRRSGEHSTAGFSFTHDAGQTDYDQLKVISTLASLLANGDLSSRFVYDFERVAHALTLPAMVETELQRLLLRHTESHLLKQKGVLTAVGQQLRNALLSIYKRSRTRLVDVALRKLQKDRKLKAFPAERDLPLDRQQRLTRDANSALVGWLGVAEFTARGGDED